MSIPELQVFTKNQLQDPSCTIDGLQGRFSGRHFSVEGDPIHFNRSILRKITRPSDLLPNFTVQHQNESYFVSLKLMGLTSTFFKQLEASGGDDQLVDSVQLTGIVSATTLKIALTVAHGGRVKIPCDCFDEVVAGAHHLGISKIQEVAKDRLNSSLRSLDDRPLTDRLQSMLTHPTIGPGAVSLALSSEIQHHLLRATTNSSFKNPDVDKVIELVSFARQHGLTVSLNLSSSLVKPEHLDLLKNLTINKLNVFGCSSLVKYNFSSFKIKTLFINSTNSISNIPTKIVKLAVSHVPVDAEDQLYLFNRLSNLSLAQRPRDSCLSRFRTLRSVSLSFPVGESDLSILTRFHFPHLAVTGGFSQSGLNLLASIEVEALSLIELTLPPQATLPPMSHLTTIEFQNADSALFRLFSHQSPTAASLDFRHSSPLSLQNLSLLSPSLKKLTINTSHLESTALNAIQSTELLSLRLNGVHWASGISPLLRFTKLDELSLVVRGNFVPSDVMDLSKLSPLSIFELVVDDGWPQTADELDIVTTLKPKSVRLKPAESMIESLTPLNNLRDLTHLDLSHCRVNEALKTLDLSNLKTLRLFGCRWLKSESITYQSFPNLEVLDIRNTEIDLPCQIEKLMANFPKLSHLQYSPTR